MARIHLTQAFIALDIDSLGLPIFTTKSFYILITLLVRVRVVVALTFMHSKERRLSNIYVAGIYQFLHVAEKECEQQSPDVGTVYIRVCHNNHFVVTHILKIKLFSNAPTDSGNDRPNLNVREHLIDSPLASLDVKNLTLERQNCLISAIPALFG